MAVGNFALTAALLQRFAVEAAAYLPAWEIIDTASAGKRDAPSGMARELAWRLAQVGPPIVEVPVTETVGAADARGTEVDGSRVHSVRLPGYSIGLEVRFGQADERLTIAYDGGTGRRPVHRRDAARDPAGELGDRAPARSATSCSIRRRRSLSDARLQAVVFDVGETLIDETRTWGLHADAVGFPCFTFLAADRWVIAWRTGASPRIFSAILGIPEPSTLPPLESDLYPDARPCLARSPCDGAPRRDRGRTSPTGPTVPVVGLDLDLVATSGAWGVAKPAGVLRADRGPTVVAAVGHRVCRRSRRQRHRSRGRCRDVPDLPPARPVGLDRLSGRESGRGVLHLEDLASVPDVVRLLA